MSMYNGNAPMSPPELFVYWINEREWVRKEKEAGNPKPWSEDPVFQTTYFCNVRREDDKVTKWIRNDWALADENYEFAMVLARLINKPETLMFLGYPNQGIEQTIKAIEIKARLCRDSHQAFWGNAYVVTTHGQRMDKLSYLAGLLRAAHNALPFTGLPPTCSAYHSAFKRLEGFADFMAAQIVADLKNTSFHRLVNADDWWTFVAPGPGSKRGMNWYFQGAVRNFYEGIKRIRDETQYKIPPICNQDLQNCLCEFDKYMRVRNGTGRSKRNYPGV